MNACPGALPVPLLALAVIVAATLWIGWRLRKGTSSIVVAPEDPLMLDAFAEAAATRHELLEHVGAKGTKAAVKLKFISDSDQVEYLWAEVIHQFAGGDFGVRLLNQPATHSRKLDEYHRCELDDVMDWMARDATGRHHGGFTDDAMVQIALRDGVPIPRCRAF